MTTSVYRYYDSQDRLIYVGITGNQVSRIEDHARNRGWWPQVSYGKFAHYATREQALLVEANAIAEEMPMENKAGATISQEAYAHLMDVLERKFTDYWHTGLVEKYDEIRKDIYSFSTTPAAYQIVFSLDRSIESDENQNKRKVDCPACEDIVNSRWFQYIYPLADNLICDEAVAR